MNLLDFVLFASFALTDRGFSEFVEMVQRARSGAWPKSSRAKVLDVVDDGSCETVMELVVAFEVVLPMSVILPIQVLS